MGKPTVILPPPGNSTGINSAKADKAIKKTNTNQILEDKGKEGIKYTKRVIANPIIIPI